VVARFRDWLRQARRNLESARLNRGAGLYEESCYEAHQAAEKAVKALLNYLGKERRGHSLTYLARDSGLEPPQEILECLLYLDKQYIPTRYPDAFAEGAPMDYYTDRDAEACIKCAEAVLGWAEGRVGGAGREV
jgi:HEPN domain-containing protein